MNSNEMPPQMQYAIRILGFSTQVMNTALQGTIGMSALSIGFSQADLEGTAMFFQAPDGYPPERLREVLVASLGHLDQIILAQAEPGEGPIQ